MKDVKTLYYCLSNEIISENNIKEVFGIE